MIDTARFAYSRNADSQSRLISIGPNVALRAAEAIVIESFRDLNVWKKAMDFVVEVYSQTEELPASERFGLISQIRRAAVSIPSNIAEGKAVGGQRYRRHLKYALGSEAELHTQIELARRLNMLGEASTSALLQDLSGVGRMITALLQALPRD